MTDCQRLFSKTESFPNRVGRCCKERFKKNGSLLGGCNRRRFLIDSGGEETCLSFVGLSRIDSTVSC